MDEISADIVWGAAAAAQRINGTYIKVRIPGQLSNGDWLRRLLRAHCAGAAQPDCDGQVITDADLEQGRQLRAHVQGWMMAALAGWANPYQQTAFRMASQDSFAPNDNLAFAVISSLPNSVFNDMKFQGARDHEATSQPLPIPVRGHFEGQVRILISLYSEHYGTNYVTALTEEGNLLRFSTSNQFKDGEDVRIRGRVRGFVGSTTRLHYVKKVVDQKGAPV